MARKSIVPEFFMLYHDVLPKAFGEWRRFEANESGEDKPRVPTLLVFDDGVVEFYSDGFGLDGYTMSGYYCLPKSAEGSR